MLQASKTRVWINGRRYKETSPIQLPSIKTIEVLVS